MANGCVINIKMSDFGGALTIYCSRIISSLIPRIGYPMRLWSPRMQSLHDCLSRLLIRVVATHTPKTEGKVISPNAIRLNPTVTEVLPRAFARLTTRRPKKLVAPPAE